MGGFVPAFAGLLDEHAHKDDRGDDKAEGEPGRTAGVGADQIGDIPRRVETGVGAKREVPAKDVGEDEHDKDTVR